MEFTLEFVRIFFIELSHAALIVLFLQYCAETYEIGYELMWQGALE